MSTIQTNAIVDASGGNTTTVNGHNITSSNMMGRNLIINGAMKVAQRGTSVSTSSTGYKTVDRFYIEANGSTPTVTISQDTASTPDTFTQALKLQVTSTATPSGFNIAQKIEGYNFSSAGFGKTTAKNITLSFWVRSSITGTYSTAAMNSTANRSYVSEYTINTADTWEKKTITIDGDTTGTWPSTSGMSLQLFFCLDNDGGSFTTSTIGSWIASNKYAGSANQVNWAGTNGATFYITGVQLEVGDTSTDFEHRSYGEELMLCSRYYQRTQADNDNYKHFGLVFIGADTGSTSYGTLAVPLVTTMRTVPSLETTGNLSNYHLWVKNTSTALSNFSVDTGIDDGTINGQFYLNAYASVSAGAGSCGAVRANNTSSAFVALDAEL
tara:strand:- start:246 stop:1394 length:1149 start_codon:yes stop_codon:yes gene_type:complete